MPGSILDAFTFIILFSLYGHPHSRYPYYFHFTDRETEAQRTYRNNLGSGSSEIWTSIRVILKSAHIYQVSPEKQNQQDRGLAKVTPVINYHTVPLSSANLDATLPAYSHDLPLRITRLAKQMRPAVRGCQMKPGMPKACGKRPPATPKPLRKKPRVRSQPAWRKGTVGASVKEQG